MKEVKIIKTWYRSILSDGTLWCESSDPGEVIRMSEGYECIFQKIVFYETTDGWEKWNGFCENSDSSSR